MIKQVLTPTQADSIADLGEFMIDEGGSTYLHVVNAISYMGYYTLFDFLEDKFGTGQTIINLYLAISHILVPTKILKTINGVEMVGEGDISIPSINLGNSNLTMDSNLRIISLYGDTSMSSLVVSNLTGDEVVKFNGDSSINIYGKSIYGKSGDQEYYAGGDLGTDGWSWKNSSGTQVYRMNSGGTIYMGDPSTNSYATAIYMQQSGGGGYISAYNNAMYYGATAYNNFSAGGIEIVQINSSGITMHAGKYIYFNNSTNNPIYFGGTGTKKITIGGNLSTDNATFSNLAGSSIAEFRGNLDSYFYGNVGIGTAPITSARLFVNGSDYYGIYLQGTTTVGFGSIIGVNNGLGYATNIYTGYNGGTGYDFYATGASTTTRQAFSAHDFGANDGDNIAFKADVNNAGSGNAYAFLATAGHIYTVSAVQRHLAGAGTHITRLGGDLSTDKSRITNLSETTLLDVNGDGSFAFKNSSLSGDSYDNIFTKRVHYFNYDRIGTGGSMFTYAGNANDRIQSWFNESGTLIADMKTASSGSVLYMNDHTGVNQIEINGRYGAIYFRSAGTRDIYSGGATVNDIISFKNGSGVRLLDIKGTGTINCANLPTSSAGLVAGDIWNNAGVLNIV